jgi:hypothetical protein
MLVINYIEKLQFEVESVAADVVAALFEHDAVATGKTLDSLEVQRGDRGVTLLGGKAFGLNRVDRPYVEGGRGEGTVPPYQDIAEWCVARGLAKGMDDKKIINAIRWSIAKKGTRRFRENDPRDIVTGVVTDQRVEEIMNRLLAPAILEASSEIIKSIQKK